MKAVAAKLGMKSLYVDLMCKITLKQTGTGKKGDRFVFR